MAMLKLVFYLVALWANLVGALTSGNSDLRRSIHYLGIILFTTVFAVGVFKEETKDKQE